MPMSDGRRTPWTELPMQFPATNPVDDPAALWAPQLELLGQAETLLGSRDQSKKVYQPQFTDHGPNLRNTRLTWMEPSSN